jgi:predicted amidohydrolase
MIEEAVSQGAELIIMPEMFNCPYENTSFPDFAESYPDGETVKFLAQTAKENKIYLVGGSVPESAETESGRQIFNTSFFFDPQGQLIVRHRKVHLFDIDIEGGISFRESDTLGRGDQITVAGTKWCDIGLAICYDMRFPELMRAMVLKGAKMILIPAAFNTTTGPAHWEITLKTRAVDNQTFVIAASPARNLEAAYHAYGHSLIVDPWGEILAEAGTGEEIIYASIDLELADRIRRQLPLLRHRRTDLYRLEVNSQPMAQK